MLQKLIVIVVGMILIKEFLIKLVDVPQDGGMMVPNVCPVLPLVLNVIMRLSVLIVTP